MHVPALHALARSAALDLERHYFPRHGARVRVAVFLDQLRQLGELLARETTYESVSE